MNEENESQQPAEAQPIEAQPAEPQPIQAQPAEPQPIQAQPSEVPYSASGAPQNPYGYPPTSTPPTPPTPPVPPTPPTPQAYYPGYEPPMPEQKRRWPWFLLGLAVGLVIGLGGCASCAGIMALAGYNDYDSFDFDDAHYYDDDHYYDHNHNYNHDYDDLYSWPPEDSSDLDDSSQNGTTAGTYTLEEIAAVFQNEGIEAGQVGENTSCPKGYYTVGRQGQIPAGLYYLEGSQTKLSYFYVFEETDAGRYEADDSVQYFGNYYADLDEGDVIVFDPGADVVMHPASSTSTNPQAPYTNGCYRVGIDIPAGSYTITAAAVDEGETEEDSAAYVMQDLDWDDDSIVDTRYVIPGGQQVITVSAGQYLELFAATATPVSQG